MSKTFTHGLIVGKFYPLHAGHSALIRAALRQCETVTVELLASSVESISLETRAEWIRQEHPTVHLVTAMDDADVDFDSPTAWDEHMIVIEQLLDEPVDAVFTSDEYGAELARRLDAEWVQVDAGRLFNSVHGRSIRADLEANWSELPVSVRETLVERIVFVGAESTGKTTLSAAVAEHYGVPWVPEYGRLYTEIREGGAFTQWRPDEFDIITDRQIVDEQAAARRTPKPFIIGDTDVFATALWYERYLEIENPALMARASEHWPLLYILAGDEIPWVDDGTRDGEHIRHAMHERFREELEKQPTPWLEVRGSVDERVALCVAAIDAALAGAHDFAVPLELRQRS